MVNLEPSTDDPPDHRAVEEIQEEVAKQVERNVVSRFIYAMNDKWTISTWRSDLNRILRVFNVRSITFVWPFLTVRLQTQLPINTNATDKVIYDVYRMMGIEEWAGSEYRSVGVICTPFITE